MDTNKVKYTDETLNLRSFYLRFLKKIWILPVAAFIGAILAGGIYYLVTVTFGPERRYEAQARFYLTYSDDAYIRNAEGERVLDWYNGATWTNFIFNDHDFLLELVKTMKEEGVDISQERMKVLEAAGGPDISNQLQALEEAGVDVIKDESKINVKGDIISNERFLLVTINETDKELVEKLTDAFIKSLESYPTYNESKAFESIVCMSKSDVYLEKADNRMGVAIVFGAILAVVLAFLAILLIDAVDEAIYVPEECEKRYGIRVLGTVFQGNEACDLLRGELAKLYDKYVADKENIVLISSDAADNASFSEKDLESVKKTLGSDYDEKLSKIKAISASDIGAAEGAILAVPYGKKNAAMTEHLISQLKKIECPVLGIVFTRADLKFIKRYYGIK
ncbi:Capsular polysaccharide biosynthesis protein [Butyrivibrio hungatei]|uniref:Capsular polysaccharide biosynthesis protein n=1 Tax=Butyrivibrio hungatei TaxID=185008 RepID=A0A1G5CDP5_9FIRM|nr:hypothetical protein [Butyrivibrio hungatei]MEE3469465.1 hypothetical protein [Butyrivibrio hungatei]SCY00533.1 Capsular polysaccharide biosynthesis protein [Butyrivibrio hungatei]